MPYKKYKFIELTVNDDLVTVTLNRPDLHNAFNEDMIEEITDAFTSINDGDERVVVIKGAGKSFCAGADLNWMKKMKDYTEEENERDARALDEMFYSVYSCSKPVIAYVQGGVFGGGTGILAASDIVIAHKDTKFGFTEVKLGLVPAVISSYLVKRITLPALREFLITGSIFDTEVAKNIGLLSYVEEDFEKMDKRLECLIKQFFSVGPNAISATKELVSYQLENDIEKRREKAPKVIAKARISTEGQEGISAFLEKRKPSFLK